MQLQKTRESIIRSLYFEQLLIHAMAFEEMLNEEEGLQNWERAEARLGLQILVMHLAVMLLKETVTTHEEGNIHYHRGNQSCINISACRFNVVP